MEERLVLEFVFSRLISSLNRKIDSASFREGLQNKTGNSWRANALERQRMASCICGFINLLFRSGCVALRVSACLAENRLHGREKKLETDRGRTVAGLTELFNNLKAEVCFWHASILKRKGKFSWQRCKRQQLRRNAVTKSW